MVRIIAPACRLCQTQMQAGMIYAEIDNLEMVNPIDLNLARWIVAFRCLACGDTSDRRINDVMVPIGGLTT